MDAFPESITPEQNAQKPLHINSVIKLLQDPYDLEFRDLSKELPVGITKKYLDKLHLRPCSHRSADKMKAELIRRNQWSPGLMPFCRAICNKCITCIIHRRVPSQILARNGVDYTNPRCSLTPSRIFQEVHIDHFTFQNNKYLVMMDALSRWIEISPPVKSTTAHQTGLDFAKYWVMRGGIPECVRADNAIMGMRESDLVRMLTRFGISSIHTIPNRPQSNGLVENSMKHSEGFLPSFTKSAPI